MPLQQALTDAWLAKGDLVRARLEAEEFLTVTLATEEHTYRALAYEANARVAVAEGGLPSAEDFIKKAVREMKGYEVPLAGWQVHATASELYERLEERDAAEEHRQLSRATIITISEFTAARRTSSQDFPLRARDP